MRPETQWLLGYQLVWESLYSHWMPGDTCMGIVSCILITYWRNLTNGCKVTHLSGDSDAGASVGDARGEVVDVGSLVVARQAARVVLALVWVVRFNVPAVLLGQLLNGAFYHPVRGSNQ